MSSGRGRVGGRSALGGGGEVALIYCAARARVSVSVRRDGMGTVWTWKDGYAKVWAWGVGHEQVFCYAAAAVNATITTVTFASADALIHVFSLTGLGNLPCQRHSSAPVLMSASLEDGSSTSRKKSCC